MPAQAARRPKQLWGSPISEYTMAICLIAMATGVGLLFPERYYVAEGIIYLLAIIVLSLWVGRAPILLAGVVSALTWDYVFIPPHFTFRIDNFQDALLFAAYFVVALVAGQFAARIRILAIEREHLRAVRERERLLAESERLHRALFDSVSHELRTPLAVITAALEGLDKVPSAERAALVEEIRIAATRLNRVVGNLLDQTRLDSGTLKPRFDWCDACDLVNAAVEGVSDALQSHPLEVDVPEDMPPIRADFALTEQALANLLLNASLHTPPGAEIYVAAGLDRGGTRAFLVVADRGPGIAPELREKLFGKFVRAHAPRAGGLGLGLSIVRGFVSAQGGSVSTASNPDGGSVFAIYLPHSDPQAAPSE